MLTLPLQVSQSSQEQCGTEEGSDFLETDFLKVAVHVWLRSTARVKLIRHFTLTRDLFSIAICSMNEANNNELVFAQVSIVLYDPTCTAITSNTQPVDWNLELQDASIRHCPTPPNALPRNMTKNVTRQMEIHQGIESHPAGTGNPLRLHHSIV